MKTLEKWLMIFAKEYLIEEPPTSVEVDEENGIVLYTVGGDSMEMNQVTIMKWMADKLDTLTTMPTQSEWYSSILNSPIPKKQCSTVSKTERCTGEGIHDKGNDVWLCEKCFQNQPCEYCIQSDRIGGGCLCPHCGRRDRYIIKYKKHECGHH